MFQAGNIISNTQFFDASSMSSADVQDFFASQNCTPSSGAPCLSNYSQTTSDRPAGPANGCTAYSGAVSESAATIVARVAQACRISPKVLLVVMQKEQTLVTRPTETGYKFAMGWGCPDTGPCDQNVTNFFSQVYKSAWQFREYTRTASSWRYRVGDNLVQYNPNSYCGATEVQILNQATANLYIYTPYQPNEAALANLHGTGDDCSSYGNRNFWRIFSEWFGSPTDTSPIGQISNAQPQPGGIAIWGWALDPDTPAAILVHAYLDGIMVSGNSADQPSPGMNTRFGLGDDHGFAVSIAASPGVHTVCMYGINVGSGIVNTQLGCASMTVGGNPHGVLENVVPTPGGITVSGWAFDPDTSDSIWVHFYVDGQMAGGAVASQLRSDVGAVHPGFGDHHGFSQTIATSPGLHQVCAYGINVGSGTANTQLGCSSVASGGNPTGALDRVDVGLGKATFHGWTVDPDTNDPILVHLYLDGQMVGGYLASASSTELGALSSFGVNHGFSATMPVGVGLHTMCAYGINVGSGNNNTQLGCQNFTVGGSPIGVIGNAQPAFDSVNIWGWAYDPDTASSIPVHVYIDGAMRGGYTADLSQNDALNADYGDKHAYSINVPTTPGVHQVCVYALNSGYGRNTQIGCFTTTVSGDPVGTIDNIQTVGSSLGVWGIALDPDTAEPIMVHAYLDGVMVGGFAADQFRSDIAATHPSLGGNHAYGFMIPASQGAHTVCVYAINVGFGTTNTQLGCVDVSRQ
jgi:hypothetical protein